MKIDGLLFQSKAEAKRYTQLKLLEKAKEITDLKIQVPFPLYSKNNDVICKYIADFVYFDKDGKEVVEDVKGVETNVFKIKKKWFESQYKQKIQIVK